MSEKAKQLVEDFALDKTLGELYNSIIYERSKNPPLYMMKFLISKLSQEERTKYGIELTEKFQSPEVIPIVKFPNLDQKSKAFTHLTKTI